MNISSPLKSNLINLDFSPTKAVVSCDINAWMETHKKASPPRKVRPLHIPVKFGRPHTERTTIQFTNLA